MGNLEISLGSLQRRSEAAAALSLARELSEAAGDEDGVSMAIFQQMADAVQQGRFAEAEALAAEFSQRPQPPTAEYRPGGAEFWRSLGQFFQGKLTDAEWQTGYDLTVRHRNVSVQHEFLALRAESDLCQDRPARALEAIEQALQITKKLGAPRRDYHDLRAWALARAGRTADAQAELQAGAQGVPAAEAHRALGDHERAKECALKAYRWAWCEGPPYTHWYYMERSRALLKQLGESEPQLPAFDPSKVPKIPFEKEIRAAIERLRAERAARKAQDDDKP